jgi:hypothetical protein
MNLVTPKFAAKRELLLNKPASVLSIINTKRDCDKNTVISENKSDIILNLKSLDEV